MTAKLMRISLSQHPAETCWGDNALLSVHDAGITIHLVDKDELGTLQRAACKIDGLGIKKVKLAGIGWGLEQSWAFWQGFRGPKDQRSVEWAKLPENERQELDQRLKIIDWVRDIINQPAEDLSPLQLAEKAADLICQEAGDAVSYQITQGEDLREQNYAGIYTVGRGSDRAPALLALDYNPTGELDAPLLACLVGKGITFDSGGYSLKQSTFMDSMKSDMGGAATVVGALALAIARGLKQRVKLYLCCAENMVSDKAFKLGDIIRYRNDKNVEVMNTDAEGRLVLADGLIEASKQNAALIIDCATLTGAAKTALGNDYHALFSFDDALAQALLNSAERECEPFWRLPLTEFHRSQLSSNFVELSNVAGAAHSAGASTAAAFLSYFVKNYQQGWLHIDCSASYRKAAVNQWAAGATGLGVRTLANLLLTKADEAESKDETDIAGYDADLWRAMEQEARRQEEHLELIASENYASLRVMQAQGSPLTNKYAEGYLGKRYYGGCKHVDKVEQLAIDRAKKLFGADYANVQPHSGSQANAAVYMALLKPGDTVLGMDLAHGGHLTHGAAANVSGKLYNIVSYGVDEKGNINYDALHEQAEKHKPKMIIGGFSAYSGVVDWKKMREIADSIGAYLFVDMAHVAGLVAADVYPTPLPHAHVVTTTTHKTLAGPRGGLILAKGGNEDLYKKLNAAVFPGSQGGPLMHVIAAKAVALKEAMEPAFKAYQEQVAKNAKIMVEVFLLRGYKVVSGSTHNHLFLLDLVDKNLTGSAADAALGRANITVNKNCVPNDPNSPSVTSGIRIGTPAVTRRGFKEEECKELAGWICDVLDSINDEKTIACIKQKVLAICARFPVYPRVS